MYTTLYEHFTNVGYSTTYLTTTLTISSETQVPYSVSMPMKRCLDNSHATLGKIIPVNENQNTN